MTVPPVNVNLGDWSKPAKVLVKRVSDAVGGIAKPWQIRRVARAEADASLIKATADLAVTEQQRRSISRFVREESQKQENIEDVTAKALPHVQDDSRPEDIEEDWITHFFDRCRLTSDKEMQELWARILAGEANSPGAFSKRTVNLVATLDKEEAAAFTKLCGFAWDVKGLTPLIYDAHEALHQNASLSFSVLNHLTTIGLISHSVLSGFEQENVASPFVIRYFDRSALIDFPSGRERTFPLGQVMFTQAGYQLARVCEPEPVPGIYEQALAHWSDLGFVVASPYPRGET